MRPFIGITCSFEDVERRVFLNMTYLDAVEAAGGVPLLLAGNAENAAELVGRLDGIVFTGGVDVDPRYFGESPLAGLGDVSPLRDDFELPLLKAARERQLPALGICRGCQIMCISEGGDIYQDLPKQLPDSLQHVQRGPREWQSHAVAVVPGTRLADIAQGVGEIRVNSFHHQAVRDLPAGWRIAAKAPDGVIEAFEDPQMPHWLGVQWHPECLWRHDETAKALFASLINAAREVRVR